MIWYKDYRTWIFIATAIGALGVILIGYLQYKENLRQDYENSQKQLRLDAALANANNVALQGKEVAETNLDSTILIFDLQKQLTIKSEEIAKLYSQLHENQKEVNELTKQNLASVEELNETVIGQENRPRILASLGIVMDVKGQDNIPKEYKKKYVGVVLNVMNDGSYPFRNLKIQLSNPGGNEFTTEGMPNDEKEYIYPECNLEM